SSDVTVSNITVLSATQIAATLTIAAGAATGARNITVGTSAGTSGPVTFTVNSAPLPTLASIAPVSGSTGSSVPVTLTGTNFISGATAAVSGSGVTASNI